MPAKLLVVHQTQFRIRLRWSRLLDPRLAPQYLEAWLENVAGVRQVRVNPRSCSIIINHDGRAKIKADILAAMNNIPRIVFASKKMAQPKRRLADAAFHLGLAMTSPFLPPIVRAPLAWAMGLPAVLRGAEILINKGLKAPVLDMTTIGFSLLRADYVAAVSISSMLVVGEYLRQSTEDRSNNMLKSLMADPVERVWVQKGEVEQSVPFAEVQPGDLVLVGAGELIAVDGEVEQGEALIDKSSISGEFEPEHVRPGDQVISGCVVVEGKLRITARQTGHSTSMARIAGFMEKALEEKSTPEIKSERLADASTPLTLGMGALLYAMTGELDRTLSLLTIDYACAVKFPAPVILKGSMYAASRQGVLVKSGSNLDGFNRSDAFVFDKTGTLTEGQMQVTDIVPAKGISTDRLLCLAASAEERYCHPIGLAVVQAASQACQELLPVRDADFSVAHGVSAVVDGMQLKVGSYHFIVEDCGLDCREFEQQSRELRTQGKSLIYVAADSKLLGILALQDRVRPEAAKVLTQLRNFGVRKIVVLSGDHKQSVQALQNELPGVDEFQAQLLPEEKAQVIKDLQAQGYRVAVVGDGINDAPAFVAADVGICMSSAAGLARESAGVVLMRDSLEGLVALRKIGQRADELLQSSFATGVTVNTGLMLAAGAGKLSPALAATAHNMTTFAILGRAMWAMRELNK